MPWGEAHFLLNLIQIEAVEEVFGVSVGWAPEDLPAEAAGAVVGDILPAVAPAFPRLSPGVHQRSSLRREWHRPLLVLATLQLRLAGTSPPTAHIPGDLLPSGSQTHKQLGRGARFILQDSVFLLFLSSQEAPRY